MKQAKKPAAKEAIVSGVVRTKTKRNVIIVLIFVAILAGLSAFLWNYTHKPVPLTDVQSRTQDVIPSQEVFLEESKDGPKDLRAIALGNLAQSYAYTNQCGKAKEALRQAKEIAPDNLKVSMQVTEEYVKGYCQ